MASKRRLRRNRCVGKEPLTKEQAIALATKMRQRHGQALDGYPCDVCGNWHVGRRPKYVQKAIDSRRGFEVR